MSIEVSTLPSGLRVITDRIETVESASLGVWVGVGTRNEPAAINGVSHLLEHMAFKGTARRSAVAIAQEIEAVGGHLNAYTSRENTAYYARVLKEDAALALDIVSDILQHATFDADELERERAVIVQEIGQALDTPEDVVFDAFQEAAYPDQPLGRTVLGDAEVIRTLPRDALIGYMRQEYRAPRMVLSAAGKVDHREIVDQAADLFGGLSAGPWPVTEPGRYIGGERREVRDLEQVHMVLGFSGVSYRDDDYYAAQILSTLLGGGMSSRLFQEVREKRGLVYSIYSFASGLADGGLFGIYAGTGEGEANEVLRIVCDEIMKLGDSLGEDEVRRARAQIKAGVLMSRESTSARSEQAAQHMLIFGRPLSPAETVASIDAVDIAAVRRVLAKLLSARPCFAAAGPVDVIEPYDAIAARLR